MARTIPIGMCLSPDSVPALAPGYDYLEFGVSSTLSPLTSDADFAPEMAKIKALKPVVGAFNLFVPGDIRVTGPEIDQCKVERYVESAIKRVQDVGADIIVFGSGGARKVAEGYNRIKAWDELIAFCNLVADKAAGTGVTVVIEPLNMKECNILTSYAEGVELAKEVKRDEIKVLADIFHFMMDGEPLEDIVKGADWLYHVHLADTGRLYPGSGSYPNKELFDILHDIDYKGKASVECRWGDDFTAESAKALAFLRELA